MTRSLILSVLLFAGSLVKAQSEALEQRIKAVEQGFANVKYLVAGKTSVTIEDKMAYYRVKGLSIAVIKDYKLDWAKAYGFANEAEKKPVTVNTLFEPGSISKSLNGLLLMRLVQEGRIDLHADINSVLKSWQFPYGKKSKGKKISLAHLLSHTAGLTVHGFPGYRPGDNYPTIPQILDGVKPANTLAVRSYTVPGKVMEYSGGGTMISELMAMDVTGMPYDQLVAEKVFKPLDMQNSFFTQPPPADRLDQLATGYNISGVQIRGKYPVLIEQAAGGLWTTPTDLSKFIIEIQLSALGKANHVLDRPTTELMLTPYKNEQAAMGVFLEQINGHKYFSHSAGNLGFSGRYVASLEDGNGVVVFINSDGGGAILEEVIRSVAQAYHWKGLYLETKLEEVTAVDLPKELQTEYSGTYQDGFAICTISSENSKMYFTAAFAPWEAHFINDSLFINVESPTKKEFVRDRTGKIIGFNRLADGKVVGMYKKITVPDLLPAQLEKYTGLYVDKDNSDWLVSREGDKLFLELYGSRNEMHFITANSFYLLEDFGVVFEFVEKSGKIEMIKAHSQQGENLIKRK